MVKRAGIYCRISDDRLGTGLGVSRQEEDCRKLCVDRGWDIAETYVDNDVSAFSGKVRPQYRRLLDALAGGEVTAVVAWHPDRLHRSPRELEDFIDLLERTKATVATVTAGEYDLGTASGRTVARIVGAVARGESEHKSERIRRKHLQLAEQGRSPGGGTRPYGWDADRVTVRADEADRMREAATRILAGDTLRGVAADWNRSGVTTSTGGQWTTMVLRRAITSWRLCGVRSLRGEPVADGQWEPILDRTTVERLRRLLLDPARRSNRDPRRYLLTGIATCALCGAKLVARPRSDKRRCYVCATGPNFSGCGKIRVLADPFEDLVAEAVIQRLDSPDLAAHLAERSGDDGPDLGRAVADDEAQLEELAEDWAEQRITRAEWAKARAIIEKRLEANRRTAAQAAGTTALEGFVGASGALREAWPNLSLDRRRAVISTVVEAVTVSAAVRGRNVFDPDRIGVVWKI